MNKIILTLLFPLIISSSYSKTIVFESILPTESCTAFLLQNILKVIDKTDETTCNIKYHYVRLKIVGDDTLYEIFSYDQAGMRDFIINQDIFGLYPSDDCLFFIDVSLSDMFCMSGKYLRVKIPKSTGQDFSFNDCYIYWKFEKINNAFALAYYWNEAIYRCWYDLIPNDDCFYNYKDITIEYIEPDND